MKILFFISFWILIFGHLSAQSTKSKFGIFRVQEDGKTVEMKGVINHQSFKNFLRLVETYPKVDQIIIVNCEGSSDDEVNLKLAKFVYKRRMKIHLDDNGIIASGGVDFYLAGSLRTYGEHTRIGVHSWSGRNEEATDYPVGHKNHLPYINYYQSIGFSEQEAKDFYYFTINSSDSKNIHWMTKEEIYKYKIISDL